MVKWADKGITHMDWSYPILGPILAQRNTCFRYGPDRFQRIDHECVQWYGYLVRPI